MKFFLIIILTSLLFVACNNAENTDSAKHDQPQTHEDSLFKDVMDGHDFAMARMNRIPALQKRVQQAADSINKLPEKLKKEATVYKAQLDSLSEKLKYADFSMNKWMEEFNYDSATKSSNRNAYLESENKKITGVKEAMLSALHAADSLFKK